MIENNGVEIWKPQSLVSKWNYVYVLFISV